jgi:hypothetical protein
MNFEPLLDSGLAPIELLLDEVPPFLRARQEQLGAIEDGRYSTLISTTHQAYSLAGQYALDAVAHLLNAFVDDSLLALANVARGTDVTIKDMYRSRATLLRDLEEALQTKPGLHPGWEHVEQLREDVNALKHRGGANWGIHPSLGVISSESVEYSDDVLRAQLLGVRSWLASLAGLVREGTSGSGGRPEYLRLT